MPTLEITTMVGCPLRCTYCPQDQLRASYGNATKYLSIRDFRAALAKLPPYVRIDFSGMAEPWANPEATFMLEAALVAGFNVAVYTTLYGMDDVDEVIALLMRHRDQVEAVVLHLPDRNGNMRGYKPSDAYADRLRKFLALRDSSVMRFVDVMTMDRDGGVHDSLSHLARLPPWVGNGRAGALDEAQVGTQPIAREPRHTTPLTCSFTSFYDHNVMLPNGDVVLCCMDYSVKHKIGNLLTGSYWSLFVSDGMNALREANMHYGETDSICRKCSRAITYDRKPGANQFWEPRE